MFLCSHVPFALHAHDSCCQSTILRLEGNVRLFNPTSSSHRRGNQGFVRHGGLPIGHRESWWQKAGPGLARPSFCCSFPASLFHLSQASPYMTDHTHSKSHLVYVIEALAPGRREAEPQGFPGALAAL